MTKLALSSLAFAIIFLSVVGILEANAQKSAQGTSKACCERPPYH